MRTLPLILHVLPEAVSNQYRDRDTYHRPVNSDESRGLRNITYPADLKSHYYITDYQGNIVGVHDGKGNLEQQVDYYPYGEPWLEPEYTESGNGNRYLFGGKERIFAGRINEYDFHARTYLGSQCRFSTIDPLTEKTPWLSPYTFCASNPVNFTDPDGRKIIFINGYIGFGSPPAGEPYWNSEKSSFVNGAKSFFNDNKVTFTYESFRWYYSVNKRVGLGYEYAKLHYDDWISDMESDESFKLVSHSMGGAFSKGIENYLKENGRKVEYSIMLNTFQIDRINNSKSNETIYIDYINTNDPVLFWFDINLGLGSLDNTDLKIREKSGDVKFSHIHRFPIDYGHTFWNNLSKYLPIIEIIQSDPCRMNK